MKPSDKARFSWASPQGFNSVLCILLIAHHILRAPLEAAQELSISLSIVVQSLSCVWLFATPWTATRQASLSFTASQCLLKFMFIALMMPSNNLILCHPFSSCLQSFPASGSFPGSQLFTSGGQSTGASASVLPMNIQSCFHLELTGLIFLYSQESFPALQFESINSLALSFLYGPTLTSIHDYWENRSYIIHNYFCVILVSITVCISILYWCPEWYLLTRKWESRV